VLAINPGSSRGISGTGNSDGRIRGGTCNPCYSVSGGIHAGQNAKRCH
jgi:hypothetical protein